MQNKIALVTGATRGIGRAIAEELASKGAFVIGTATSEKGADTISAYLGDKGKGLAKEVASRGITVNVVAPGFIATDMTEVLTEEQKAGILGNVPAGRLGEPKDIAKAVAFLASDDAAYI